MTPEREKITRAAIRFVKTGRVYTGAYHWACFLKALRSGEYLPYRKLTDLRHLPNKFADLDPQYPVENGFITSTGRFVNREEAAALMGWEGEAKAELFPGVANSSLAAAALAEALLEDGPEDDEDFYAADPASADANLGSILQPEDKFKEALPAFLRQRFPNYEISAAPFPDSKLARGLTAISNPSAVYRWFTVRSEKRYRICGCIFVQDTEYDPSQKVTVRRGVPKQVLEHVCNWIRTFFTKRGFLAGAKVCNDHWNSELTSSGWTLGTITFEAIFVHGKQPTR